MIYKFRAILDNEEDIFRDIEIQASASFEDFHNAITQAFGFDGTEMASFYLSDTDWNQGEEISLFDMSETGNDARLMHQTALDSVLSKDHTRVIYVYDFLNMWTFLIELADIAEPESGRAYPNLLFAHGVLPDTAPEQHFQAEQDIANLNALEQDPIHGFDLETDAFDALDNFDDIEDLDNIWN